MILGELLLERPIAANELRTVFAQVLHLEVERIALVSTMAEAPPLTGAALETTDLEGDFPLQLCIYTAAAPPQELTAVAAEVAALLDVRILVPSNSPDPYVMVLVEPTGIVGEVNLDTESLDELGVYKITR